MRINQAHALQLDSTSQSQSPTTNMISDNGLYSLAVFLGGASVLMIVLYHFLEINSQDTKEALARGNKRDANTVPGNAK